MAGGLAHIYHHEFFPKNIGDSFRILADSGQVISFPWEYTLHVNSPIFKVLSYFKDLHSSFALFFSTWMNEEVLVCQNLHVLVNFMFTVAYDSVMFIFIHYNP